jgi:fibronectin type 3 domain-containing protein
MPIKLTHGWSWRTSAFAQGLTMTVLIGALLLLGSVTRAQTLNLRYAFDDAGPGTTTPSDTSLGGSEVNVTLNMLNKSGVGTNLHGAALSGVAGLTNPNRAMNCTNTSQGGSGNYASVTNSALGFGNVGSFVVTMWMKQAVGLPGNTGGRMFILGNSTNSDTGTANSISMKWQDASHLYFYVNAVQATATFASNLPTNTWLFVAMAYDGANVTLYEGTESTPAVLNSTTATSGQIVPLGSAASLYLCNRPDRARDFAGWVDDFRFYTGSGTASFVESVRQASAGPSGLTAVPNDSVVNLSWTALSGATSYNINRAAVSGGPYTTISTAGAVTGTTYSDTPVVNGTTYYYAISAQTAAGTTANGVTEASATPNVPPPVPTGLTPTAGNSQIALTWNPSAGAATYNVKRSTTSELEVTITNVSTVSFTDTGVINGIPYFYEVSALGSTGSESGNSGEVTSTPVGPPPAPTTLTAYGAAIGEVGLSWSVSPLATSYNVYRSATSGGTYTMISTVGTVTGTGYVDTTASGRATYYYKVSAFDGQGEGPLSAVASASPLATLLRFDFSDTGTTTSDSISNVVLNMVNGSDVAQDYHGVVGSGVDGDGKTLDFSSNPFNSPTTGPLASSTLNPALAFGTVSNFTLTFWVKPNSDFYTGVGTNIITTNNPRLFMLSPTNVVDYPATIPTTLPGLFMKINAYDSAPRTGEVKVFFNNNEYVSPAASFISSAGEWSYVAITYDGATLKLYSASDTIAANTASAVILSASTNGQLLNFTNGYGNLLLGNNGALAKSIDGWMSDVRFYTGGGDSNFVENVRLLAANPPGGVSATGGNSQVGLSWNAFTGANSYNIKRATASGGPYTTISTPGSVTATSFTDSTAVNGNTYYYVISAATVYGESGDSAEVPGTAACTPPAAPTAGNDGPICSGSTLNLTASTVAGATYSWTGPNGFVSTDQNPSIAGATAAASGVYSVTVTVGGCTSDPATTTAVVTEADAPTVGYNSPLYAGMTLNLTASTVAGATYSWTGPNGFVSSDQNPSIAGVDTTYSGTYSVTVTIGACTSAPATTNVTVNPAAALSIQSSDGNLILNWPFGTLQSATNIAGPWTDVAGATSPYTITPDPSQPQVFYRIQLQ